MALDKKGVFFTFTAFIFISLLIYSISIGSNYELREKSFAVEIRIDTMNNFISDIEEDMERGAYIAGFRSFIELEEYITSTGEYIIDLESKFNELFINGTINNSNSSILANNTFTDWVRKIEVEAEKIDIVVNFSINSLDLLQDDPWKARIDINITTHLFDKQDSSRWDKEKVFITYVDIDGLGDPIYLLETNGFVENRVRKSNLSYFVNGTDISNLLNHTYEGDYVAFNGAPSYLMRLEGNFSSSEYGIESLVDIDELSSKGVSTKDKSIVDYIYFGISNPAKYSVSGAPSWFKLDNSSNMDGNKTHLDLYEVNDLVS